MPPYDIDILVIAESPPAPNGSVASYFYFEENPVGDRLFATIVCALLPKESHYRKNTERKKELLNKLKNAGFFLMDAVEFPINKDSENQKINNKDRELIIQRNSKALIKRLKSIKGISAKTRIILLKETVHNQLYSKLKDKYNVLNKTYIPFPYLYRDKKVVCPIRKLLV